MVTVDPTPAGSLPSAALVPGAAIVDVTARWAIAGSLQHDFDEPLEIVVSNASGSSVMPATFVGVGWRTIAAVPGGGTSLPANWADGFYRAADGIHILTRHLTLFSLLRDFEPPSPPEGFAAVVAGDGLTIRWAPGTDDASGIASFELYVNGEAFQSFDAQQFEVKLGDLQAGDTREFTLTERDGVGNESGPTKVLKALPALVGLTVDQARSALAARGFQLGNVTTRVSSAPVGTVLDPAPVQLRFKGSAVDLVVSSGATQQARLRFNVVGTKRVVRTPRTIGARIRVSTRAQVTASLHGPKRVTLYTWRVTVRAGTSIVRLRVPAGVLPRLGQNQVVWVARAGGQLVRRTQPVYGRRGAAETRRLDVVIAGAQAMRDRIAPKLSAGTRLTRATLDGTYAQNADLYRHVKVVVVDLSLHRASLVSGVRVVFPGVRVLALGATPRQLVDASRAGATVALPRSTPPARIAAVIERLARG